MNTMKMSARSQPQSAAPGPARVVGVCARFFRDDRGQVTLLAAIMSFLIAFLALIGLDTNVAINNRITSQNAVDAAADSAALWQARGCNLLQTLNNLHYDADQIAGVLEGGAAVACGLAEIPWLNPAACPICATLPIVDASQQQFNTVVMRLQQVVAQVTPILAFVNANACAKGSGASSLPGVVSQALSSLSELGIPLPGGAGLAASGAGGLAEQSGIGVYALPLDPTSLSLHVSPKKGNGWPWNLPSEVGMIGNTAGESACPEYSVTYQGARWMGWDEKWGWHDSYYFGNPGFMTWVAGKAGQREIAGLGHSPWMNGGRISPDDILVMYNQAAGSRSSELLIPPFLAVASSQVEGSPVVGHGDVDAHGKLIKVYFTRTFAGEKIGILH